MPCGGETTLPFLPPRRRASSIQRAPHFSFRANNRTVGKRSSLLGQFYHDSRNRLNSLRLTLYMAGAHGLPEHRPVWSELEAEYRAVEQVFEHVQIILRPLHLCLVRLPLSLLIEDRARAWHDAL